MITSRCTRALFSLGAITLTLYATSPASAQELSEDQKLTAGDAAQLDLLGFSVSVSGNSAVIGAPGENGTVGSVYVFDTTTGTQQIKLTADSAFTTGTFGNSVSVSGNIAVVGAPATNAPSFREGDAYVFDTTTGQQLFRLLASDRQPLDQFGYSVSVSGNTAVIGTLTAGAAYVFDTTTGQELFKLTPNDAGGSFGETVAVSGSIAVVGAPTDLEQGANAGAAYVFDTTTGTQLFKLFSNDIAPEDRFGTSVSISGSIAVIGATGDDDAGPRTGAAYVFDTTTGQQLFKLKALDPGSENRFGRSVSVSGSTAVVGSDGESYIFDTSSGTQLFKLTASDFESGDAFGWSVGISGSTAVIGAQANDDAGTNSGSAYAYLLSPSILQQPVGVVVNPGETAVFNIVAGNAADVQYQWRRGGIPLVDAGNISGATTPTLSIVADVSDEGAYDCLVTAAPGGPETQSVPVVLAVLTDANPCVADLNGDGVLNFFDVSVFLSAYSAGCP